MDGSERDDGGVWAWNVTGPAAARAVQSVPLSEGCVRWSVRSQPTSLGICALKPVGIQDEGAHWVLAAQLELVMAWLVLSWWMLMEVRDTSCG
jgi:hypothetical protein